MYIDIHVLNMIGMLICYLYLFLRVISSESFWSWIPERQRRVNMLRRWRCTGWSWCLTCLSPQRASRWSSKQEVNIAHSNTVLIVKLYNLDCLIYMLMKRNTQNSYLQMHIEFGLYFKYAWLFNRNKFLEREIDW